MDEIGVKFDPIHIAVQGMDPVRVIKKLGRSIYGVHAQDVQFNEEIMKENGLFTTRYYDDIENRPWTFRLVGFGFSRELWQDMITALFRVGYNGTIMIENFDVMFTYSEGFNKGYNFLKQIIVTQKLQPRTLT